MKTKPARPTTEYICQNHWIRKMLVIAVELPVPKRTSAVFSYSCKNSYAEIGIKTPFSQVRRIWIWERTRCWMSRQNSKPHLYQVKENGNNDDFSRHGLERIIWVSTWRIMWRWRNLTLQPTLKFLHYIHPSLLHGNMDIMRYIDNANVRRSIHIQRANRRW